MWAFKRQDSLPSRNNALLLYIFLCSAILQSTGRKLDSDLEVTSSIPAVLMSGIAISVKTLFTNATGQGRWRSEAGKVTAGMAESNGSLLTDIACRLSASETGNQHWSLRSLRLRVYTFTFYLLLYTYDGHAIATKCMCRTYMLNRLTVKPLFHVKIKLFWRISDPSRRRRSTVVK